jgi:addiction module HigA family antidote
MEPMPLKLWTITDERSRPMLDILPPVHPGEILREEYLVPLDMSAGALAKKLDVPRTRIERIIKEETAVTPDTALRLAKFFGTSPELWTNMQSSYDLKKLQAEREADLAKIETRAGLSWLIAPSVSGHAKAYPTRDMAVAAARAATTGAPMPARAFANTARPQRNAASAAAHAATAAKAPAAKQAAKSKAPKTWKASAAKKTTAKAAARPSAAKRGSRPTAKRKG